MKGKSKTQKGITLIALIITIVVLLILAVVTVSAIQNDGIISHAQNAATKYNGAQGEEANTIAGYLNYINNGGVKDNVVVEPKVGQYVEYDVSYTDMYQGTTYTKTNGWRYLGKDNEGNHLLISTAIPIKLNYHSAGTGEATKWWDTDTTLNANVRATNGMLNNLTKIPYVQGTLQTVLPKASMAKGTFQGSKVTVNGTEYDAIGDYFKVTEKTYSSSIIVRTLTLAELNRAVNSANSGVEEYIERAETSIEAGFKDLTGDALGLFDLKDLSGYTASYEYWIASPYTDESNYYVCGVYSIKSKVWNFGSQYGAEERGFRPVIVLSSEVELVDQDGNGVWEIQ